VENNPAQRKVILDALDGIDIQVSSVADGRSALRMLREKPIDCLVLSRQLPDLSPTAFADEVQREPISCHVPVVVFGDSPSDTSEDGGWKRLAESFTVRRAHSPERLLDLASLYLHRDVAKLPEAKRLILQGLHTSDKVLAGKKVLIVDDDMRNIFALSTVLEDHDMNIVSAGNGRDAIKILQTQPDIDIVLMDIMMPEMDGIDTMREIRKIPKLKGLPIIAVTAKAMKGDREKCIEAGAWDYLSKPVDAQQMLAVLRAWLHR
jgi:CheY-like chemotaxis protein